VSTMIERVAEGLRDRFRQRIEAGHARLNPDGAKPFNQIGVAMPSADIWKDYARAAMEAMREPTDIMENAAFDGASLENGISAYGCWQDMIDAALKETP